MSTVATYVGAVIIALVLAAVAFYMVRSTRRWRQPAPGKSLEARAAEDRIEHMTFWDPTGGPG